MTQQFHPREQETWMFITALLAQRGKQPTCPPTDEWIHKMWYIHTMEGYLAVQWNKLLIHAAMWVNLENMLNKRSQTQKTSFMIHLYEIFRRGKSIETIMFSWTILGMTAKGYGISFGNEEMF